MKHKHSWRVGLVAVLGTRIIAEEFDCECGAIRTDIVQGYEDHELVVGAFSEHARNSTRKHRQAREQRLASEQPSTVPTG